MMTGENDDRFLSIYTVARFKTSTQLIQRHKVESRRIVVVPIDALREQRVELNRDGMKGKHGHTVVDSNHVNGSVSDVPSSPRPFFSLSASSQLDPCFDSGDPKMELGHQPYRN